MTDKITVVGIMDKNTGLLWNRVHKKFMPLTQNTLLIRDMGQYKRLTGPDYRYRPFCGKKLIPVEIEITIKGDMNDK